MLDPFRLAGTDLPRELLLVARLMVIVLVFKGYWLHLPKRHLPFVPAFEALGSPEIWKAALMLLFALGAVLVYGSRHARWGCLLMGAALILATLGCRPGYANSRFYSGCLLTALGLYEPSFGRVLLRGQIFLLYFGAAVNKIFDVDWLDGRFFESWMTHTVGSDVYRAVASGLPPMTLSRFMGWATIAAEVVVAIGVLHPRLFRIALIVGVAFHAGAMLMTSDDFGAFFYAVGLSYVALFPWPERIEVRTSSAFLGRLLAATNRDGVFAIADANDGTEAVFGGEVRRGAEAWRTILLHHPGPWFVVVALATALPESYGGLRSAVVSVFLLLLIPLSPRKGVPVAS